MNKNRYNAYQCPKRFFTLNSFFPIIVAANFGRQKTQLLLITWILMKRDITLLFVAPKKLTYFLPERSITPM